MKIKDIQIKGIKSHKENYFHPEKYTVLVGENNCGKSNILFAIRWFFGDIKLKQSDITIGFTENPSVIITFELETSDKDKIDIEEKWLIDNCLKIEGYYDISEITKEVSAKYKIHGLAESKESKRLPFKFELIFIPSVRELDDELKFTANSAINKLISKFVINRIKTEDEKNDKYKDVYNSIINLSDYISTGENSAFERLKSALKDNMLDYPNIEINFKLVPFDVDNLIKNSFKPYIRTNSKDLPIESQGMGFQRSLIFSLISSVTEMKLTNEIFNLYLIEEPELFLHPNHQTSFRNMLLNLSEKENCQVVLTSHSPYFLNNVSNYSQIKRISLINHYSQVYELTQDNLKEICNQNGMLMAEAKSEAQNPKWDIVTLNNEAKRISEEDELRYLLWVDPERANAFLSKKVILVEGKTEKAFFSFMINNPQGEFSKEKKIVDMSVIDVNGKYHFYKFANLLNKLGILCWIMYDGDEDKNSNGISHKKLNEYINQMKDDKIIIDCLRLDPKLEKCLGFNKDENKADIALYYNLSTNYSVCKSQPQFKIINKFVRGILEKKY